MRGFFASDVLIVNLVACHCGWSGGDEVLTFVFVWPCELIK